LPQAIEIESLRIVRGGHVVIPGMTVDVPAGTVTGLLGPSGSGKSTLIRAIVGVQIVEGGIVRVLGAPAGSPTLRRRVAYDTQAPSLYNDLTVDENLRYFARVLGVESGRESAVVDRVQLTGERTRVVGTLSGGQRARVSLATALLGSPELLVLDEPTVGLDPVLRRDLWAMFHELAAAGTTLLVSSHVMDEAERCDTLLLIREGELVAAEAPETLKARTGADDMDTAFLRLIEEQP
jgi:ABC-2 type transport system ATP-binding protein